MLQATEVNKHTSLLFCLMRLRRITAGRLWDFHPVTNESSTFLTWALNMSEGAFRSSSRGSKAEEIKEETACETMYFKNETLKMIRNSMMRPHLNLVADAKLPGLVLGPVKPIEFLKKNGKDID